MNHAKFHASLSSCHGRIAPQNVGVRLCIDSNCEHVESGSASTARELKPESLISSPNAPDEKRNNTKGKTCCENSVTGVSTKCKSKRVLRM